MFTVVHKFAVELAVFLPCLTRPCYYAVTARYIPEIIGKGGANRKAIQDHTETKISIPANVSRDGPPVKITIAGTFVYSYCKMHKYMSGLRFETSPSPLTTVYMY